MLARLNKSKAEPLMQTSPLKRIDGVSYGKALVVALGLGSVFGLYGVCLWGSPLFFTEVFTLDQINLYVITGLLGSLVGFLAKPASSFLGIELKRWYRLGTPLACLLGLTTLILGFEQGNILVLMFAGFFVGFAIAALFMYWVGVIAAFPPKIKIFVLVITLILPAVYNAILIFVPQVSIPSLTCVVLGTPALCTYFVALRKSEQGQNKESTPEGGSRLKVTGAQKLDARQKISEKQRSSGKAFSSSIENYRKSFQELIAPLASATVLLLIVPAINFVALEDGLDWRVKFAMICGAQLLAALIVFMLLRVFKKTPIMVTFFLGAVPVLAVALFLFPFMGGEYGRVLLMMGSCLYFIVAVLIMADSINVAPQNKVDPTALYGLCGALTFLVTYFGEQIMRSIFLSGISRDIQMIATAFFLIYLLGIVFLFVQNRKKERQRYDLDDGAKKAVAAKGIGNSSISQNEVECCTYIQETKGLSNREIEVLHMILRGKNVPAIAKELYVSQNTVRTHVKKIYRNLGVHSRQELIEYVEALSKEF